MLSLIRMEFLVSRWLHTVALLAGLGLISVAVLEPENSLFIAFFTCLIYAHQMVFGYNRVAPVGSPDHLLVNSLPVTRGQVVAARYLCLMICSTALAAYLTLVLLVTSWFVSPLPLGAPGLFMMLALLGLVYHLLLIPLSYVNARYGNWASIAVYFVILLLPLRLGNGDLILRALVSFSVKLGTWALPMALLAGLCLLGLLSYRISRGLYLRAEF